ncbi:uncharacterized protein [Alexandromys fortis]|uniref:uncharacterized protein isoform X3 n=1 Tax=Alexandromys fortis TaxID=100897 RepID=UPI002152A6CB|nr:uncharacterized protein LOC126512091 isoform X3 [Microtus fortis]
MEHSVFPHPATSKHSSSLTLEGKGGPGKIETAHGAKWRKGFMDGVHLPPSDQREKECGQSTQSSKQRHTPVVETWDSYPSWWS